MQPTVLVLPITNGLGFAVALCLGLFIGYLIGRALK